MTPCSAIWDWSRLDGNMGVGKSNFNINNFWWDLCQRLWDWTWIKRVDYGLSWAQGVVVTVGFRSHIENLIIGHFEGLQTYTSNFTILYIQKASVPVKCVWKEAFFSGITENWQQYYWSVLRSVSLFYEDSSRSVKANWFVASANICMLLSSLLYPCHSKCFSFSSVYRNGRATPPFSIQHNQIYSGLSTRLVGTICLRQTLRAFVCHWPVSTNIILSSSILGCSTPLFS